MLFQVLVEVIEKNVDKLTREWLKDVQENRQTPFYHSFEEALLYDRALGIYKNLGQWLTVPTPKAELVRYYKEYGKERCREGFPLSELLYSFILFRRHLWLFILHEGLFDTAYELRRALELNNRVILYFDRAMHSVAMGYEECKQK